MAALAGPLAAGAEEPVPPVLRIDFKETEAVPGQPLVLRLTVLVPTWLPEPPVLPSFELPNVMVRLPERASGPTSERVEGETWSGVTRAYRLYPMKTGRFRLPPLPVTVIYADPETREPLTTKLLTETVSFRGVAPEGAQDLNPFIAANALELKQNIAGNPGKLVPGDAFTRTVTVRVKGTSPIFIPPLIPSLSVPGIAAYPKEPVVSETMERGIISGSRVEAVTYVAEAGGQVSVPPIRLRWFDLGKKQVVTAEAESFEIFSDGPPPATPLRDINWRGLASWVIGFAFCLLILAFVAWRLWPRLSTWRRQRRDAYLASEGYAYAEAKEALRKGDLGAALSALVLWTSRLPAGISSEEQHLSEMLARLGAAHYRHGETAPSAALWVEAMKALSTVRRHRFRQHAAAHGADRLPPLNPLRAQ